VREVQARLAAPGWDGIATAEEGGVFVIGDGVLEMVDVAAHAAEEGHGEEHTIAGIDVNSTLLCTDELLKHTVRLLDQREQQIADILTGDDHILADPANKKCFTAPEPSVVGLSHEPVKQYWNQFD
jgi:hypothetical protein